MKDTTREGSRRLERTAHRRPRRRLATLIALVAAAVPAVGHAGGLPATQLLTQLNSQATLANGDYVSDVNGLSTAYRYFVEVPPSLGRLQIDVFDADIGAGTVAGNDDLAVFGGFDSCVTYTVINPAGTTVSSTRVGPAACGGTTTCAACDGAWVSFFDSNATPLGSFRDQFGAVAYNNNDGTLNWAGSWTEFGDDGAAGSGGVLIQGGQLAVRQAVRGASRLANLTTTGATTATLTYDVQSLGNLEANDCADVSVSADGGTTWTVLNTVCNDTALTSFSHDISAFIATNSGVRLRASTNLGGGGEFFAFDNVNIAVSGAATPMPGHWQLRVDSSTAGGGAAANDLNLYAVRAHDGTPGAGGTELNVYASSYLPPGVLSTGAGGPGNVVFRLHPYVTSSCVVDANDFDADDAATPPASNDGGSIALGNPAGFSQGFAVLSGGTVWANHATSGWTTDTSNRDAYGMWTEDFTVITPGAQTGNIITHYLASALAANPPPSAQPEAGSFRIYLPTDAGGTPAEAFVDQVVGLEAGPNPPQVGSTTTVTVTVRVSNPGARAVTFSTPSNVVTANVPGGGAVYGGAPQVSQGSLVSQPAVGGTGNVVWNPGTLAAGASALLGYRVNVTPTSNGQRIPVTGTPAVGGTRATFVDGTCTGASPACSGAQLTGATFTFGPLCELALTEGIATPAVVSSFDVFDLGGGSLVRWSTASEIGTFGFYLERLDPASGTFRRVHDGLLPAVGEAPGGSYRFVDGATRRGERPVYRLVEVDLRGAERIHGPFAPREDVARRELTEVPLDGFAAVAHGPSERVLRSRTEPPPAKRYGDVGGAPRYGAATKLAIAETGVYRLTSGEIAAALGLAEGTVRMMLPRGLLRVVRQGRQLPWFTPDNRSLVFYAEGPTSPFSPTATYWLQALRGSRMLRLGGAAPAPQGGPQSFAEELHFEKQLLPRTFLVFDPEEDFWFWDAASASTPGLEVRPLAVEVPGVGSSPDDARLTFTFYGLGNQQQAEVRLNGTTVGEIDWSGVGRTTAGLDLDPSLLAEGANTIEVEALPGLPANRFLIDAVDLAYARLQQALDDRLALTAGGRRVVTISGFTSPAITVLDVDDPTRPRRLDATTIDQAPDGSYRVSFTAAVAATRYWVASDAGMRSPLSFTPARVSRLRTAYHQADEVVITPAQLADAAAELAAYRRTTGLAVEVVDLEDVYDDFNGGDASPEAIRDFLAYTQEHWLQPPHYVVLAGKGSFDYRDYLGLGGNLLPPLLAPTFGGLVASDGRYGDLDDDGVPELAVGRIPALTAAELTAYLDKLRAYEATDGSAWEGTALMVADKPDGAADFGAASDQLSAVLSSTYGVQRIDLGTTPLAAARQALGDRLRDGASVFSFVGHGGTDRLAAQGVLLASDTPTLGNGDRLPVVTAYSCNTNLYAFPGLSTVGEELVVEPTGGAAAVWGPSGLAFNAESLELARSFFRQLSQADSPPLGDLLLAATRAFATGGGETEVLALYTLLGDPAMQLKTPAGGGAATSGGF